MKPNYEEETKEDYTSETEKEWHDMIFEQIEDRIVNDDTFEDEVMSRWDEEGEYPNPKAKEFLEVGCLSIKISQEKEKNNGKETASMF